MYVRGGFEIRHFNIPVRKQSSCKNNRIFAEPQAKNDGGNAPPASLCLMLWAAGTPRQRRQAQGRCRLQGVEHAEMSLSAHDGIAVVKPSQTYVAKAHHHQGIETIAYMLDGECAVYYGHDLANRVLVGQGEQCFVAADVPHAPDNESGKPCTWIVVHSSGKRFRMASCCCPSLMPNWRAG
ncbi:MAG TPA: cupin domain-containing protein [Hyphomicrobiaceae bacterium]|nr:cupin domain-containing protein [Hyphomicrobiaceae bacterium]